MATDGSHLEELVSFVERTLLPFGKVATNRRAYDDDGKQIAEFDVEVHGRLGSTNFDWLIECRDRPSEGPAPAAWIEQLVGRRSRFGFNKVTAVSTTGFAPGAVEYANDEAIELRSVNALSPEEFGLWLPSTIVEHIVSCADLKQAWFAGGEPLAADVRAAFSSFIETTTSGDRFLWLDSDEPIAPVSAFVAVVEAAGLFAGVEPGIEKPVALDVHYPPGHRYSVRTPAGAVEISRIRFEGKLSKQRVKTPLNRTEQYVALEDGRTISQRATFASANIFGQTFTLEMHRIGDSDTVHLIAKRSSGA